MKNKILSAIAVLALLATVPCFGQGRGVDLFGVPRPIQLAPPTLMNTIGTGTYTNTWIDTHAYDGIAAIYVSCITNAGNSVVTATVQTSVDSTNWVNLSNYAIGTNYVQVVTNLMYGGTNTLATNTVLYAGTIVNPVSASAGWATPYINPAPFTNTGAFTPIYKGWTVIGYNVADAARYAQIVWTISGGTGATNVTASALFDGFRSQ